MRRAAEVFVLEERALHSPFVEKVWRAYSQPEEGFISVAATHWEIVVCRLRDRSYVTVRGPETRATTVPIPQDAEFFGVQFRRGAFMPGLPPAHLVDDALTLPEASGNSFWLHGAAWELPAFDNLDAFVERLVRAGLLARDPVVEAALRGDAVDRSARSVQRRVVRATGLTQDTIRQIERAEQAVALIERGRSILETARLCGYADQAHLTRSLKRFAGQTPGQIVRAGERPTDG
jgi:AraC-like DNA-binding protein